METSEWPRADEVISGKMKSPRNKIQLPNNNQLPKKQKCLEISFLELVIIWTLVSCILVI